MNAMWKAVGGGTFHWGTTSNWQSGIVPGVVGDAALFGGTVGSNPATILLDASRSLSNLTFSAATGGSYTLSGSGGYSLQLANGGNSASITVTSGSSSINAPVVLGDNLNVAAATGTSLSISQPISESGGSHALTLSGGGTLTLSGTKNTFTGGVVVTAGTLNVTTPTAIPNGSSLTVGAGGTFVFDPSLTGARSAPLVATNLSAAPPICPARAAMPGRRRRLKTFALRDADAGGAQAGSSVKSGAAAHVASQALPARRVETGIIAHSPAWWLLADSLAAGRTLPDMIPAAIDKVMLMYTDEKGLSVPTFI